MSGHGPRSGSTGRTVRLTATSLKPPPSALHQELIAREAEVLYWLVKGKADLDIGDILGSSPRTVQKHLEHVFEKLGVETRTAAAAMAMGKVRGLEAGR